MAQLKQETTAWQRWLLVLPASVAVFYIVKVVGDYAFDPRLLLLPEGLLFILQEVWLNVIGPIALVLVGAFTAPKFRFPVAVMLALAYAGVNGVLLVRGWRSHNTTQPFWFVIFWYITGVCATFKIADWLQKEEEKARREQEPES